MSTNGLAEAERVIDGLDEPRRSQMRHLHEVIMDALPGIDITIYDYGGSLIGYGSFDYTNSKGPAGRWFSVGLASRKSYISLYSMATRDGLYVVEFDGRSIPRRQGDAQLPEHPQAGAHPGRGRRRSGARELGAVQGRLPAAVARGPSAVGSTTGVERLDDLGRATSARVCPLGRCDRIDEALPVEGRQ